MASSRRGLMEPTNHTARNALILTPNLCQIFYIHFDIVYTYSYILSFIPFTHLYQRVAGSNPSLVGT